jgi:M6 family metalloprotease-like protein
MVGEACNSIDSELDFSQYDNDGDGECDVIIVLYAGVGEASSGVEDSVWPCQWELSSSDYGKNLTLDNTKVSKFAVFNELNGEYTSKIDGIGTFCHEFSHCLDLPDFYDTQYGPHFGMANWSLMDYGSYNDDGYTPIGYSAYEKWFMGWIDLDEYTENTQYTLPVFNQKNIETDKAVKITNDKDSNEYYILENRANQGWDKYMPAEGLMITHVTYKASSWTGNTVNDYDTQLMTIIPADGELKMDTESYYGTTYYTINEASLKGDLWPYNGNNELTDTSSPAAKVNTGSYMSKPITEITKNSDGTVSFWVMKGATPTVATPINVSHNVESETSATISWEAGDDTDVTYTVEVAKYQEPTYELVSSTDFTSSSISWTEDGSVNSNNGETYLGSSKRTGSLTSPVFTTGDDGVVSVVFYAKYYDSGSSIKVSLLNSNGSEVDTETVTLTGDYEQYCVVFNGTANAKAYICFESLAARKRVYLRSADIYKGDASSIVSDVRARAAAETMTFTGITETHLLVENLETGETYTYRVKAVPTNSEEFADSKWSEKGQFTLDNSAVSTITVDTNAAAEYFTLQGIRVKGTPTTPGIYVRRAGSQTLKVVIK